MIGVVDSEVVSPSPQSTPSRLQLGDTRPVGQGPVDAVGLAGVLIGTTAAQPLSPRL